MISDAVLATGVALLAGGGTYLLYQELGGGRAGRPDTGTVLRVTARLKAAMTRAGLDETDARQLAFAVALLAIVGGGLTFALFGGVVTPLVGGAACALIPIGALRARRRRRQEAAREAWPRMLEEMRLLTGTLGRSIPQALFEAGRRGPEELRDAFRAAEREWLVSTDFARTVTVLKAALADPTADAALETLLVAHEIGGADLDRRLAALIVDRSADLEGRKDALAKQAGVRFARWFVIIVPVGMAIAGLLIGDGRDAYATPAGQAAVLVGVITLLGCWLWAGRLLRLPESERVLGDPVVGPPAGDGPPQPHWGERRDPDGSGAP